jgi:hypothetical protein
LIFLPLVHTEEVTGSIPVSPTQLTGQSRSCDWPFWILVQQQSAATGLRSGRANAGRLARESRIIPLGPEPQKVSEP